MVSLLSFRLARFTGLAAGLVVAGCQLQKDVDIPQPAFTPQLAVECYLVPGQPLRLVVQETTPYAAEPQPVAVTDAVAVISGPNWSDTLTFAPALDTTGVQAQVFTHAGGRRFDGQPGQTFSLVVTDGKGRRVTGTTTVLSRVPIDTVEVNFDPEADSADAKAALLTRFRDPAGVGDTYRYYVTKESRGRLDRQQGFSFDDDLFDGRPTGVGSSYRFEPGDTLRVNLYHIEPAYDRYLQSVNDAQNANGNPFAQPAAIKSTVSGGIGVFTVLYGDTKRFVVRQR